MTNLERIHAGQEGIERIQGGLDSMQVALQKAEEVAVLSEQVSHKLRRVLFVVALVGLAALAVAIIRARRTKDTDEGPEPA